MQGLGMVAPDFWEVIVALLGSALCILAYFAVLEDWRREPEDQRMRRFLNVWRWILRHDDVDKTYRFFARVYLLSGILGILMSVGYALASVW